MVFEENFSLKRFNTFGIDVKARYFNSFGSQADLEENLQAKKPGEKLLILGGGSNILFTEDINGLVLKNDIKGIDILTEDEHYVYVKAGAGENWHTLVLYCLERDLAGIENLSLIPGNVGAAPMQNIGAYGVELKDAFEELEAFNVKEGKSHLFSNADCKFGYRESVFKNAYRNQYVITHVVLRLNKNHSFNTSYGAVEEELEKMDRGTTIQTISQAIINIRSSKLPDPAKIGNAGSFFKNPTVSSSKYKKLKKEYALIPGYPQQNGKVKLAAGWLIEQAGWKGFRRGDAGCHSRQALVLVNYGHATGAEILELSREIRQSVTRKFGVDLEPEVNLV